MIKDTPLFCYNYAHVMVFQCLSCTREFNHVFRSLGYIHACVCVCSLYHHTMKCMHWFHSPLSATPFRSAQSFWARPSCSAHLGTATSRLQLHRQWENRNHEKIKQMRAVQKPDPFSETVWFFCGILSRHLKMLTCIECIEVICHHAMFSVIIGIRFFGWLPHC